MIDWLSDHDIIEYRRLYRVSLHFFLSYLCCNNNLKNILFKIDNINVKIIDMHLSPLYFSIYFFLMLQEKYARRKLSRNYVPKFFLRIPDLYLVK